MSDPAPCIVIVPAFNEQANIDPLFDALGAVAGWIERVIVADNGSTDETAARSRTRGAVVVQESQRGYGAACLAAIAHVKADAQLRGNVIVFLDADLSDDPAALPVVAGPVASGEADLVIGSRVEQAEDGALNAVQRFGNALACRLMRWSTGKRYSDLGPFRAISRGALARLEMADQTWGWTVEMQMKAAQRGLRVVEVDVPYRRRRHGRSKISGTVRGVVLAGTKIIWTIVMLWWADRRRDSGQDRAEAAEI